MGLCLFSIVLPPLPLILLILIVKNQIVHKIYALVIDHKRAAVGIDARPVLFDGGILAATKRVDLSQQGLLVLLNVQIGVRNSDEAQSVATRSDTCIEHGTRVGLVVEPVRWQVMVQIINLDAHLRELVEVVHDETSQPCSTLEPPLALLLLARLALAGHEDGHEAHQRQLFLLVSVVGQQASTIQGMAPLNGVVYPLGTAQLGVLLASCRQSFRRESSLYRKHL